MHTVVLMPGDGIGPEITDAAVQVTEATGADIEWIRMEGGEDTREKMGTPLPDETLEAYIRVGVGFKGPFAVEMEDAMIRPGRRPGGASNGRPPRVYNSATNALRGGKAGDLRRSVWPGALKGFRRPSREWTWPSYGRSVKI